MLHGYKQKTQCLTLLTILCRHYQWSIPILIMTLTIELAINQELIQFWDSLVSHQQEDIVSGAGLTAAAARCTSRGEF